jgi:hypothetical protein
MYKKKVAKKAKAAPIVAPPSVEPPRKKAAVHDPFGHLMMVHFPHDGNEHWIMNMATRKFFRASKSDEQLVLEGKVGVAICDAHPSDYIFANGLVAFARAATPSELGLE